MSTIRFRGFAFYFTLACAVNLAAGRGQSQNPDQNAHFPGNAREASRLKISKEDLGRMVRQYLQSHQRALDGENAMADELETILFAGQEISLTVRTETPQSGKTLRFSAGAHSHRGIRRLAANEGKYSIESSILKSDIETVTVVSGGGIGNFRLLILTKCNQKFMEYGKGAEHKLVDGLLSDIAAIPFWAKDLKQARALAVLFSRYLSPGA